MCARQVNQKDRGTELGLGLSGNLFPVVQIILTFYTYSSYTVLLDMVRCAAEVAPGGAPLEQNDHRAHTWRMKPSQIIVA